MAQAGGLVWLRRLFSTKGSSPGLPASVCALLQSGVPVQVQKVTADWPVRTALILLLLLMLLYAAQHKHIE